MGTLANGYVLYIHGERVGTYPTLSAAVYAYEIITCGPRQSWEIGGPALR